MIYASEFFYIIYPEHYETLNSSYTLKVNEMFQDNIKKNVYKKNIELLFNKSQRNIFSQYNITNNNIVNLYIIRMLINNFSVTNYLELSIKYNIGDWVICGKNLNIGIISTIIYNSTNNQAEMFIISRLDNNNNLISKKYYLTEIYSVAKPNLISKYFNTNKQIKNLFYNQLLSKIVTNVIAHKTDKIIFW